MILNSNLFQELELAALKNMKTALTLMIILHLE
jgi:hypothetical protein